jgi:glycosyltransferase involved in cell wall biosynthesis
MERADVFALVGWAEPFGVVFLEAMACALPVVVSSDAGVAEVLEDGVTAVFTKPRDQKSVEIALDRLIDNPQLRQLIGQAGQFLFVSNFQWSSVTKRYREILEESGEEKETWADL